MRLESVQAIKSPKVHFSSSMRNLKVESELPNSPIGELTLFSRSFFVHPMDFTQFWGYNLPTLLVLRYSSAVKRTLSRNHSANHSFSNSCSDRKRSDLGLGDNVCGIRLKVSSV